MARDKNALRHRETYNGVEIDFTAQTQPELNKKVLNRMREIDAGLRTKSANVTVREWGDKWLVLKKPTISDPVYKAYKSNLEKYIYPEIGARMLRDIVHTDIVEIINAQSDKSDWTRARIKSILFAIFEEAISDNIITRNPAEKVKVKTPSRSSRRALTDDEVTLLLKACENNYAGLWIKFLYYTGVRPQETAPLTWGRINEKTHEVNIKNALKATGKVGKTKSETSVRNVVIPEPFYTELMTHKGEPDELIFKTEQTKNTNRGGKMLTLKAMQLRWKSIKRDMDILLGRKLKRNKFEEESKLASDISLYCLRHTYCTNLCRAGVPLKTAIELMGHSSSKMVISVYGHYTTDQAEVARNLLSNFYGVGTDAGTVKPATSRST